MNKYFLILFACLFFASINMVAKKPVKEIKVKTKEKELVSPPMLITGAAKQNEVIECFVSPEQMAQFPGGDAALMKFIASHLQYPPMAQEQGIQGKCIVQFVVTMTGSIGEVKVVRSVSPEIDNEAVRVVRSLPAFTPGKAHGQPVNVWYTLPLTFKITDFMPTLGEGLENLSVLKWNRPEAVHEGTITIHTKINADGSIAEAKAISGTGVAWQDSDSRMRCETATMKTKFQPTGSPEEGDIIWTY